MRHVSQPSEYSVPGTLFDTVEGRHTTGMLNTGYCFRACCNSCTAQYASKPPITISPSMLNFCR